MRVLIWNIGGGHAGMGSGHTRAVSNVLRRWRADIHLLQEVNADQVEPLKNAVRGHAVAGLLPWSPTNPWRGDVIISRWPFRASHRYTFQGKRIRNPQPFGGPFLSFIWGRIDHPARRVHLLSVHYPLHGDQAARIDPAIRQWTCSVINNVIFCKELRETILTVARQREAVILGGDFNAGTINQVCDVRFDPESGCDQYFPPPHCERVDVAGAARLVDGTWPGVDGAAFSRPDGSRPGFVLQGDVDVDEAARQIAEHAPVIYDLSDPTPPEPASCRAARARVGGMLAEINRLRSRLRDLSPRDPDYREIKRDIETQVRNKKSQISELREWADQAGCDKI
jgi:endonuclease/exonuclease/phosphatase family metal-dependent hydrolase